MTYDAAMTRWGKYTHARLPGNSKTTALCGVQVVGRVRSVGNPMDQVTCKKCREVAAEARHEPELVPCLVCGYPFPDDEACQNPVCMANPSLSDERKEAIAEARREAEERKREENMLRRARAQAFSYRGGE